MAAEERRPTAQTRFLPLRGSAGVTSRPEEDRRRRRSVRGGGSSRCSPETLSSVSSVTTGGRLRRGKAGATGRLASNFGREVCDGGALKAGDGEADVLTRAAGGSNVDSQERTESEGTEAATSSGSRGGIGGGAEGGAAGDVKNSPQRGQGPLTPAIEAGTESWAWHRPQEKESTAGGLT